MESPTGGGDAVRLTVVTPIREYHKKYVELAANGTKMLNVQFFNTKISWTKLQTLMNRIGVHLCPSAAEGYGHYINEARSVGAVVLTGDIAPLNELVDTNSGVLVGRPSTWDFWGALRTEVLDVSVADIEDGVKRILLLPERTKRQMGANARRRYREDTALFRAGMHALSATVCGHHDHPLIGEFLH